MTTGMLRLITDYVRRVPWWVWLGVVPSHGFMTWAYMVDRQHQIRMVGVLFAFQASAVIQNQAWYGVLRTMPVSLRQIGVARWWGAIGIPGAIMTAASLLVFLLAPTPRVGRMGIDGMAIWVAGTWAALGLFKSLQPLLVYAGRLHRILTLPALLLWAVVIIPPISGFMGDAIPLPLWVGIGLAAAIALYVWASVLATPPSQATRTALSSQSSRPGRLSGWWTLARQQATLVVVAASVCGIILFVMSRLIQGKLPPNFYLITVPGLMPFTMLGLLSPRMLRTLPLGAGRLATVLQAMGLIPVAALYGVILLAGQTAPAGTVIPVILLIFALQMVQLPIRFRFSFVSAQILGALVVMIGIFLIMFTAIVPIVGRPPAGWSTAAVAAAIMIGLAAYVWTYYELAHGNHAYRPRPVPMAAAASFSGRMSGSAG